MTIYNYIVYYFENKWYQLNTQIKIILRYCVYLIVTSEKNWNINKYNK